MNAFEHVNEKLQSGMVEGEMHACLRDVGRLAGGLAASGAIGPMDLLELERTAASLSKNEREGLSKWIKAVVYGRKEPIDWKKTETFNNKNERAFGWDDTIGEESKLKIIDKHYLQDEQVPEPTNWNPVNDLITYLETVFESSDLVGYVTESYYNEKADKHLPKAGAWDRTAGMLIELLQKCKGDIGSVIGDCKKEVGAWIRFNPLDGKGCTNKNVTNHRFCLIESDVLPIPRQYVLMKELELPIVALVHSGKKSLHAIVKVDADSEDEYRKRVDFLWEVCQKNGLELDTQNRNSSRLSRLPGVMRDGKKQFLVATNIGKKSFIEWKDFIEEFNDDLPDIEEVDVTGDEPELAPELIADVLREGHKLMLTGPSKAGKSFSLMQLCIAVSEGREWLGWQVKKGRVLYVNLELDKRSCKHRFWSIYQALKIKQTPSGIDVWDLRGNAASLDKLTPKLIRRARKKAYTMIVIDPIYKVLTGDENSAEQMALFCNQFDKICLELKVATVVCHHHSKGAQGQKSSTDRSSGSGVFSRDPDAIIDLIELSIDKDRRLQISNVWECDAMGAALDGVSRSWRDKCPEDDQLIAKHLFQWAVKDGHETLMQTTRVPAVDQAKMATGWRIEGTVREFRPFKPRNFFYRYPLHVADVDDLLKDAKAEGELVMPTNGKKREKKDDNFDVQKVWDDVIEEGDTGIKVTDFVSYVGLSNRAVRKAITEDKFFEIRAGYVCQIKA